MTEDSWRLYNGSRADGVKAFGLAQDERWQKRAAGSFFWTWKVRSLIHPGIEAVLTCLDGLDGRW